MLFSPLVFMRYGAVLLGALSVSFSSACTWADVPTANAVEAPTYDLSGSDVTEATLSAIESVIYDQYLGGQIAGSPESVQSAFHKDSIMFLAVKDEDGTSRLRQWTDLQALAATWGAKPNTNMDLDNIKILSLDVVDDRMATVLLKVEDRVYDALTLVEIDGVWQIAAKVYIIQ